jgi:dCTP deaminase
MVQGEKAVTMSSGVPRLFDWDEEVLSRDPIDDRSGPFARTGVIPDQGIRALIAAGEITSQVPWLEDQVQPASLDLRLGKFAYRVLASFLPGTARTVEDKLESITFHRMDLTKGAVLEAGCVYVVPLVEGLNLRDSVAAFANPKSSTGRLDVFTRLIADRSDTFDYVPPGYSGALYAEICPRTFSIMVHSGSRLTQIRFRRRLKQQHDDLVKRLTDKQLRKLQEEVGLVEGDVTIRDGINLRVNLSKQSRSGRVGYKARRYAGVVDVDAVGKLEAKDFWEELYVEGSGQLVLDPNEFYILASKESIRVPPEFVAEMAPIDPMIGEYRVHYAGFFDPGFGFTPNKPGGAKAVLEVRSLDIPFIMEDGQIVGRLMYERLTDLPGTLYGQGIGSHYQAQGLKLSKHFRQE